jgi:hypothetical protein
MGLEESLEKMSEIADVIYKGDGDRDLALFLYSFLSVENTQVPSLSPIEKVSDAFLDHTVQGIETQYLLTERLLDRCRTNSWNDKLLSSFRIIRENSVFREKNILLAAYRKSETYSFKDCYSEDIAKGLEEDPQAWITILNDFFVSQNPPKSRRSCEAFYCPVQSTLIANGENENLNRSFLCAFLKILSILRRASPEDWEIIAKYQLHIPRKTIVSLPVEIQDLEMNETSRRSLAGFLVSEINDLKPTEIEALIKLLESSTEPRNLAAAVLTAIENNKNFSITTQNRSDGLWYFYLRLAQTVQTVEIHEKIFINLVKAFTEGRPVLKNDFSNAHDMAFLVSFLAQQDLCNQSQVYIEHRKKLLAYLEHDFEKIEDNPFDRYRRSNSFYIAFILLSLNPEYDLSRNGLKETHPKEFISAAKWFHWHRIDPSKVNPDEFVIDFKYILSCEIELGYLRYTSILIELIKEFHQETYFEVIRNQLWEDIAAHPTKLEGVAPTFMLLEAMTCVKKGVEIPHSIRYSLLEIRRWYDFGRYATQTFSFIRTAKQGVLEKIPRVFRSTEIDLLLTTFAASLFFLTVEHSFSLNIFVQLVR